MKLFKFAFSCLAILSTSLQAMADEGGITENKEDFHVFLLMGQSNMAGRQSFNSLDEMDKTSDPRILKMDALGNWSEAVEPINIDSEASVGPGMSFAKRLIEENPDIKVGLINVAVGGTAIAEWSRGSVWYRRAVSLAGEARKNGVLKGVLWHQGEHDMWNEARGPNKDRIQKYGDNLRQLIDDFRLQMGDAYLPWIVGGYTQGYPQSTRKGHEYGYWNVWSQSKAVGTNFFRTGYVSSKDVPYMDDYIHFTAEGQREMGRRYAVEYLKLNGFNEEKPYVGHWTWKGKEWLDSEAVVNEDGWKYHKEIGVYWDEEFPFIKHAQLGWLEISIDEDHNIRLDSPYVEKDRETGERTVRSKRYCVVLKNENEIEGDPEGYEDFMYFSSEDVSDPENPTYGEYIMVDLLKERGDEDVFYFVDSEEYASELPLLPALNVTRNYNTLYEFAFYRLQQSLQLLESSNFLTRKWSFYRQYIDDVHYFRNYINKWGWDGYHYALENEVGETREAWREHFLDLLYATDENVRKTNLLYHDYAVELLEEFHSQ